MNVLAVFCRFKLGNLLRRFGEGFRLLRSQRFSLFVVTLIQREIQSFIVVYAVWAREEEEAIHLAQEAHSDLEGDASGDGDARWEGWEIQAEMIPNVHTLRCASKPSCLFALKE